jgi:hypothetical protein
MGPETSLAEEVRALGDASWRSNLPQNTELLV